MTTEIWTWECACCFNFIKEKCKSSLRSLLEGWRRIKHLYGLPTALLDWDSLTGKALILRTAGFNTLHFISKSWNQADRCVQHSKFGIRIDQSSFSGLCKPKFCLHSKKIDSSYSPLCSQNEAWVKYSFILKSIEMSNFWLEMLDWTHAFSSTHFWNLTITTKKVILEAKNEKKRQRQNERGKEQHFIFEIIKIVGQVSINLTNVVLT